MAALTLILGSVVACTSVPLGDARSPAPAGAASAPAPPPAPKEVRQTAKSRWALVDWSDLPGWADDAVLMAWPALLRSCLKPAPEYAAACKAAQALTRPDEPMVRAFMQHWFRPWRVEPLDGAADGLLTGYFEPLVAASRRPRPGFNVPLHAPPADLATRKPWYTRAQIDTLPAAQAALRGREIAYVADALDALMLQIQGSGRLQLTEADGSTKVVRVAFAGSNDQPYRSVGRWLIDQGALPADGASWPSIRTWALNNTRRVPDMLQANPRYVFFREEALPDPTRGPLGAQGVPLTPGRSIAVDKDSIPYGTPVWLDSTEPVRPGSTAPARRLQRLVLAQDTGAAITGAVRADYFWGWGDGAEELAGRMKQPLRLWALWPAEAAP